MTNMDDFPTTIGCLGLVILVLLGIMALMHACDVRKDNKYIADAQAQLGVSSGTSDVKTGPVVRCGEDLRIFSDPKLVVVVIDGHEYLWFSGSGSHHAYASLCHKADCKTCEARRAHEHKEED